MKRLAVFADGTWNEPAQRDRGKAAPTNVVKLATAVLPADAGGVAQVAYYHEGVGENGSLWDRLSGGAFGTGISRNIQDIYRFLCINYAPGDEVWLFGFSRGAYTARSLAGLIRNCGLLKRENLPRIGDAYALYRDRTDDSSPSSDRAKAFRNAWCWPDFGVHFIGVWDTVGALGIPVTPLRFWTKSLYEFHDVALSRTVRHAYQALAIDERRKPFIPAVWQRQAGAPDTQVLEQAWFPGVHCNVGGGYADAGLSDGALLWMWDRTGKAGLALDERQRPQSHADAEMEDSMTFYYRWLGDGRRTLGHEPTGAEGAHQTSLQRSHYLPDNLRDFLAKHPPTYAP